MLILEREDKQIKAVNMFITKCYVKCKSGISGNGFCIFGIENGKRPNLFPTFRIGIGNGNVNQNPYFWDLE